ncbi:hypothetical protein CRENPOLYSF1_270009 [Crenothrix polyspora]|uniref:Uncharacterized protein n=1 Tax=Crenothrix polyspora TaxID=360316 RepID=A0A1R4H874_9GAMM|nr:hypothetical protein CRENPOLYSF1_270009 [Crenothrix polyspora]
MSIDVKCEASVEPSVLSVQYSIIWPAMTRVIDVLVDIFQHFGLSPMLHY